MAPATLAGEVRAGRPRGIARALSVIERGGEESDLLLRELRDQASRARSLGITGAPGVGKSTLVEALGMALLGREERPAVLAIDPTSPFTGGALLGDRVRMGRLTAAGAFVRSMATRGALGGIAAATADAIQVLAAAGFTWIIVETVGVGQDEVDVAGVVDSVVVVTVAGLGDDVQASKAGLLEIADVFAVNKVDQAPSEGEIGALEAMLAMAAPRPWRPPVLGVSATRGDGIDALLDAVLEHQSFLDSSGARAELRKQRALRRLERSLDDLVWSTLRGADGGAGLASVLDDVAAGTLDPVDGAHSLLLALAHHVGAPTTCRKE